MALSASGQQSCATCHVADHAFAGADGLSVPMGGAQMNLPGLRATPSRIAVLAALGLAIALALSLRMSLASFGFCVSALCLYVLRGWQLSGVGVRGLVDLARAPLFVLWKLASMVRTHDSTKWVRTRRERP